MGQYTSKIQQRGFMLIKVLAGNELHGLSLKEASELAGAPRMETYRDLKNLEEFGWARQVDGRWLMTAEAAEPAVKIHKNLSTLMGKINTINTEYLGG